MADDSGGQIFDLQRRVENLTGEMGGIRAEVGRQTGEIAGMRVQLSELFTAQRYGFEKLEESIRGVVKSNDERSGNMHINIAEVERKCRVLIEENRKEVDAVKAKLWWIIGIGGGIVAALEILPRLKGLL